MPDVITLGEVLIDFVSTVHGVSLEEAPAFEKAPGGAPANVAVGLARLGKKSGFVGMVGEDIFGHFLVKLLKAEGVDTTQVRYSSEARTMLAFVSLGVDGERDFVFYRNPSADMLHSPQDIDPGYIQAAKIFHHGSISLISEPARSATLYAIDVAERSGLIISYDPNLRLNLWSSNEQAKNGILSVWDRAHVIKLSIDEAQFLCNGADAITGVRNLWRGNNQLVVITLGKKGCIYVTPEYYGIVDGYDVNVVDTIGAGDGFMSGLLFGLLENIGTRQDESILVSICMFANAVGAITTTRRGAIPALPTYQDIQTFLYNLTDR